MYDDRTADLLNEAWNSPTSTKAVSLARKVLEAVPECTEALIIIADNTDSDGERMNTLLRALKSLDDERNYQPGEKEDLSFSVNYRLAYTYLIMRNFPAMLAACESAMKSLNDPDSEDDIKSLHYRALIGLCKWQKILALTMKDETHGLAWAYSRLIAAWMTSGNKSLCANMFWDALIIAPDVPFYMLGYYGEPEDGDDNGDFDFALIYSDVVNMSDDFREWFTRGTALFGLLTNRFDGREREYMLDVLDAFGGYEEYERMSGIMMEADDESVIETLAANKCLTE
ncbi:MAG: hypothetical protein IKQ95_04115 [Synergistaceae bacterium]|nr:hypothetical protein [Synergistaceae bacterium]